MTQLGWVFAYVLFSALDILTTAVGLSRGHAELNPIMNWVLAIGGPVTLLVVKVLLVNVLVVFVSYWWELTGVRYVAYTGLVLLILTVINNMVVLLT